MYKHKQLRDDEAGTVFQSEALQTGVFYLRSDGWCFSAERSGHFITDKIMKGTDSDCLIREKEEVKFNLQEYIMNEEQNILHEHLDKCSKDKENVISVVRLKYPDGSTQQIQITSVPSCKWSEKDCFLTIFQELKNYSGTNDVFTRLEELNLVGKIAGSVAHEVRNPLTVVRGHLQLLGWDKQLEKYHEQLETMITEIDRAVEILTELLYMSRPSKTRMERENINTILNHLYQLLNAEALVNLHEVVYELEEVPDVMLDKKRFRQVVLNLVNNGLQAMEEHSRIIIKTFTSAGKVYFAVKDHGKGIPPEVLKKIGTPFLTTKANGTGLGLSACYNIIADHRASMEVDTGPEGTTFTIIFDAIV